MSRRIVGQMGEAFGSSQLHPLFVALHVHAATRSKSSDRPAARNRNSRRPTPPSALKPGNHHRAQPEYDEQSQDLPRAFIDEVPDGSRLEAPSEAARRLVGPGDAAIICAYWRREAS